MRIRLPILRWPLPGRGGLFGGMRPGSFRGKVVVGLSQMPAFAQRTLLRLIPGTSYRWGPPRRWATAASVAARDGEWRNLFGAAEEEPYHTVMATEDRRTLSRLRAAGWNAAGVAVLRGARVLSPHGFAVGPRDTLLIDASFAHSCPASEIWRLPRIARTTVLDGRVLNLGSTWAPNNFAHQLLDVWPRWELVRRAGWDWKDFDHVLAPSPSFAVSAAVAERIGVPLERLRPISQGEQVVCETLVQPTHPSGMSAGHYPQWVGQFFRSLGWPPAADGPRRLYLSRAKGARHLANEKDLLARLSANGFVAVDAATLGSRAPGWFAAAEEIVAPHGAALAQFAFVSAGARVLEIFPEGYVPCHYASLAHAGGLAYAAVAGSAQQGSGSLSSFSVSVEKVMRVLGLLRDSSRR